MAALLVAVSVMSVLLTMAMPLWQTMAKREKEEELVFRGRQYARAVALFQRKYANAFPPNIDILLNERYLRKKYKDPMTKDGEFQLVPAVTTSAPGQTATGAGGALGSTGGTGTVPQKGQPGKPSPLDSGSRLPAGAQGGIIGVVSKSTESSLRLFNGRGKYNEWTFTPQTVGLMITAPAGSSQRPGAGPQVPGPGGLKPGVTGPGGAKPLGPGPGGFGPGGFGQPRPPQQPGQQPRPFGIRPPG